MAEISSIDMKKGDIIVNLKVSEEEYRLLGNNTSNLLLLPTSSNFLDRPLTTGKLGNSNRNQQFLLFEFYLKEHLFLKKELFC